MKDYYGDGAFNSSNPDVPDSLEVLPPETVAIKEELWAKYGAFNSSNPDVPDSLEVSPPETAAIKEELWAKDDFFLTFSRKQKSEDLEFKHKEWAKKLIFSPHFHLTFWI